MTSAIASVNRVELDLQAIGQRALLRPLAVRVEKDAKGYVASDDVLGRRATGATWQEAEANLERLLAQAVEMLMDGAHRPSPDDIRDWQRLSVIIADADWQEEYEALSETLDIMADETLMSTLGTSMEQANRGDLVDWDEAMRQIGLTD